MASTVTGRIALIVHPTRAAAKQLAEQASTWWEGHGYQVVEVTPVDGAVVPEVANGDLEFAVSLGGDGTMLRTVQLTVGRGVPVLGVNLGNMGYLTAGRAGRDGGGVRADARRRLRGRGAHGPRRRGAHRQRPVVRPLLALNEAALEKTGPGHTIRVGVAIAGRPFLTYAVDGILVATPTGSTAYNLSARGPVVSPHLHAMVLHPGVAAHALRPLPRAGARREVGLQLLDDRPAALVVDGATVDPVGRETPWRSRLPTRPARVVSFGPRDFHADLRDEFGLTDRLAAPCCRAARPRTWGSSPTSTSCFGPGMTALTGETGAGKTLVVEALELLLGGRADPRWCAPARTRRSSRAVLVSGRAVAEDGSGDDDGVGLASDGPDGDPVGTGDPRTWRWCSRAPFAQRALAGLRRRSHGAAQRCWRRPAATSSTSTASTPTSPCCARRHSAPRSTVRRGRPRHRSSGAAAHRRARRAHRRARRRRGAPGRVSWTSPLPARRDRRGRITSPDEDEQLAAEEAPLANAAALRDAVEARARTARGRAGRPERSTSSGGGRGAGAPRGPLRARGPPALRGRPSSRTWPPSCGWRPSASRRTPSASRRSASRRQLLRDLGRKYGDHLADVLAFASATQAQLADLEAGDEVTRGAGGRARARAAELAAAEERSVTQRRAAAPALAREVEAHLHELALACRPPRGASVTRPGSGTK